MQILALQLVETAQGILLRPKECEKGFSRASGQRRGAGLRRSPSIESAFSVESRAFDPHQLKGCGVSADDSDGAPRDPIVLCQERAQGVVSLALFGGRCDLHFESAVGHLPGDLVFGAAWDYFDAAGHAASIPVI
jgi:hypothetical protein